ncbi:SAM-dependent methyltransferase, partial [Halostreptopolyspora alba]|uniref:SAM-dependent methyltransferase n=1 Tax=Halostreptopolyspora alba TaxID=2487137 RepID=UPI00371229FB
LSIPHCIPDDADAQRAILGPMERAVSGSHLALSHVVADTDAKAAELTATITDQGMPWKTRTPALIDEWFQDLEQVEPGLCDISHWRPDPTQPPLDDIPSELTPYAGMSLRGKGVYEYGGVLRKP